MQDLLRRLARLVRVTAATTAPAVPTLLDRPMFNGVVATIATFILVTASVARQANISSASLVPICKDAVNPALGQQPDQSDGSMIYCVGYVAAVRDAESLRSLIAGADPAFCVDKSVSHEQVAHEFLEYVTRRPEQLTSRLLSRCDVH